MHLPATRQANQLLKTCSCGCGRVLQCELALLLVPGGCSPGEYAIIPPLPLPLVEGTDASRPGSKHTGALLLWPSRLWATRAAMQIPTTWGQ